LPVQKVVFTTDVVNSLLSYSKMNHPREGILLIRGKVRKDVADVTGVVIPPAAVHARSYSSFNWWMIPVDPSYLGVAHSHPSGYAVPSSEDLLHVTGRVMVIMGFPYTDERCLGVYNREGTRIPFEVVKGKPKPPEFEEYE